MSTSKELFLRLNPGNNTIRILDTPHEYRVHWIDSVKNSRMQQINCAANQCILCLKGNRRVIRYIAVVAVRGPEFKLLTMGRLLYNKIAYLAETAGDPAGYDIDIEYDASTSSRSYGVTQGQTYPLDSSTQQLYGKWRESVDIGRIVAPSSNSEILEKVDRDLTDSLAFQSAPPWTPATIVEIVKNIRVTPHMGD